LKRRWRRLRVALRKTLRRIVYSRSSAQSIAAGVALGVFIGLTPTVGFQMLIAAFLATLFGMNRLAAVTPVWITNPATIGPIYYFNFLVGVWVLRADAAAGVRERFHEVADRIAAVSFADFFGSLGDVFAAMGALGAGVLVPLIVGSVIVGAVAAAAAYPLALWSVRFVRRKRQARSVRRAEARLVRLEEQGLVVRTDTGRWRAVGEDAAPGEGGEDEGPPADIPRLPTLRAGVAPEEPPAREGRGGA
jgi:hypothetical protein